MDNSISLNTQYHQNPEVVVREEDEEGGLLYNPDTNQVKVVNATGLFIWKKFDKGNTVERLIPQIIDEFENVPADSIEQDVFEFVSELQSTGFVGVVEEA